MNLGPKTAIASFDVDAQCTFTPRCPDELPIPGGDTIATALNAQAALAGCRLGSKDAHSPHAVWVTDDSALVGQARAGGTQADRYWPVHAVPGTCGFELLPGLPRPWEYDYFVWKGVEPEMHPYGACYHDLDERLSTGVIEFLRARGIGTVLAGGLALDYCVKTTALQLAAAGFKVIVNRAASRGLAAQTTAAALAAMRSAGIMIVPNLDDLDATG